MSVASRPRSPASERNREPILAVLRRHFADRKRVLEVGSGTGQHAVHFAAGLPLLTWQPSDRAEYLPGIRAWLDEARLPNVLAPIELDVNGSWPRGCYDAAFSANTLHIMSWSEVEKLFTGLTEVLQDDATLVIYGPFNYGGRFTSESNAAFDASLKQQVAHMGIRDFEAVDALARGIGMALVEDCPMPANNHTLVWRRTQAPN
jgi:cyclopropane fatty-acyl-phospholipid synthase-like methyltransferase